MRTRLDRILPKRPWEEDDETYAKPTGIGLVLLWETPAVLFQKKYKGGKR